MHMDDGAGGGLDLLFGRPRSGPPRSGPPGRGPRALLHGAEGTLPDQHKASTAKTSFLHVQAQEQKTGR